MKPKNIFLSALLITSFSLPEYSFPQEPQLICTISSYFSPYDKIGLIPITISGLGTRELTLVALFSIFAVNADAVMAMSIVGIVITNVAPSLAGWYFTLYRRSNP